MMREQGRLIWVKSRTKPRTRRTSSDGSFTPIADEKINQINTVTMCHKPTNATCCCTDLTRLRYTLLAFERILLNGCAD